MRVLFCGDIVGRSGRDIVKDVVPRLRQEYQIDCVVANAENAAHGFGLTMTIARELKGYGVDILSNGNHVWDQKELLTGIDQDKALLRPLNYPPGTPGQGFSEFLTPRGHKLLVINVMGRLFMDAMDDPFRAVDELLKRYTLGASVQAILVDIHAEATSEKQSMAYFLDGRVSAVVGTHTHVPTADCRILPQGTAYQTDAGMCGDYHSVIGMQHHVPVLKFTRKLPTEKMQPAIGPGTFCGTLFDIDETTGRTTNIWPIVSGPHLINRGL